MKPENKNPFRNLCIAILITCLTSQALPLSDTIHIQVWTGAAAIQQTPVGLKGNVSAIVDANIRHFFSNHIYSEIALQCSPSYTIVVLDKALVGFVRNGFTISSGLLSTHIGRSSLYKPFSVYNQFTRSSIIWDSDGFGGFLRQQFLHSGIEGAVTLNNRENGSAYLMHTFTNNTTITNHTIIGLRTSEIEYQDNSLTIGNDLKVDLTKILSLHCAVKYCVFQGYGNSTVKPGYELELFNETKSTIAQLFSVTTMFYYKESDKSYSYNKLNCGINGEFMFFPWLGLYTGYEYQKSMNVDLHIPEAGLTIKPLPAAICIRVGGESVRRGITHINKVMAVVWYDF